MKKIYTLAGALLFASTLTAQQRISLVEQVTSASCGPCAATNPALNTLVSDNGNDIVKVTFQRGGGNYIDPMFDFNPNEVNNRIVSGYGVTHFPNIWINGTDVGSPANVTQTTIDDANAVAPTYDIVATSEFINNGTELKVDVTATALADHNTNSPFNNKIYIAVIEKTVNYSAAPGSNGETEFHSVMRKMLPNQNGTTIGPTTNGQVHTISETWTMDFTGAGTVAPDPADFDVIVFVQNSFTKEVFQAVRTGKPTAIVQPTNINKVKVYPTVAQNQLNIAFGLNNQDNIAIDILDATGKIVKTVNSNRYSAGAYNQRVDISSLTNGMYFISLKGEKNIVTEKFVVSK